MGGFKNQKLNEIAKKNIFEDIIDFVFVSLDNMKTDLLLKNKKLKNKEEEIRTHLLEQYLNNESFRQKTKFDDLLLLFNAEVAEGYNEKSEKYIGRVDIKVYSINTLISVGKDYYIIECKRLDGSKRLNEEFVTEGISRFVLDKPKYSSFNQKNIMLGFVIKNIDIGMNVCKIDDIQNEYERIHIAERMCKCNRLIEEHYLYKTKYLCMGNSIELSYMFYNLYEIIE